MTGHREVELVAHDASRSGAVLAATALAESLGRLGVQVRVRTLRDRPRDIERSASTGTGRPDLVIVNSILSLEAFGRIHDDTPAVLYIHEDAEALEVLRGRPLETIAARCAAVWCVSQAAVDQLRDLGLDRTPTHVLAPPVVAADADPTNGRAILAAADGATIVLGMGELAWHKGPDLFLHAARRLLEARQVHVAWIGAQRAEELRRLELEADQLGLGGLVHWIPPTDRPADVLAAADLVLMTSRRDAQPLVPLEAALAGTATAAFAIGGLADYADAGLIAAVPYPDTTGLAELALQLLDSPERRGALVAGGREAVMRDRTPDAVARRAVGLIDVVLAPAP